MTAEDTSAFFALAGKPFKTISIRLSPEELYSAIKVLQYRLRNRVMRQRVFIIFTAIPIAFTLAWLFQLMTGSRFDRTLIVGEITLVAALLGSTSALWTQAIGNRRLLMKFSSHPSSRLHSQQIAVGEQGIAVVADAHAIYAHWSALTDVVVRNNLILFLRQGDPVAVVPFHVFPDGADCAAFQLYVNSQMQASLQDRSSRPPSARKNQ